MCLLTSSILRAGPLTPNLEVSNFIINITVSRKLASSSITVHLFLDSKLQVGPVVEVICLQRRILGRGRAGGGGAPLILGKKEEITEGRKASRASKTTTPPPFRPLAKGVWIPHWCDVQNYPQIQEKPQKGNSFLRLKGTKNS